MVGIVIVMVTDNLTPVNIIATDKHPRVMDK